METTTVNSVLTHRHFQTKQHVKLNLLLLSEIVWTIVQDTY